MGHLPERQLRGREGDEFAIVRKVDNVYPIELKVQGHVPEVSGVDGQRRGNKKHSPGKTPGGEDEQCGRRKKGKERGACDPGFVAQRALILNGGGVITNGR